MRPPLHILLALALAPLSIAQSDPGKAEVPPGASAKDIALDNLLSERGSPKAMEDVIAAAKKSGVSDQAVLEARFLYHVDRREDDAIAGMLPDFLKQKENFKIEDSSIFAVKEDWLAVIEYVQAMVSLKAGDKAAFKTHITEAFWLSPRQASAFAPHIDRLRLEETMRAVKIDFATTTLSPLAAGDAVRFSTLIKDKKAMILHFWSPASSESEASLPDYSITAKALVEKSIAMVSIVSDGTPQVLTDARKMILPLGPKPPGSWLIDKKDQPLVRELRVQTLPVFILVSNEGKILFNGDPSDDSFWIALEKIDPSIKRPEAPVPE